MLEVFILATVLWGFGEIIVPENRAIEIAGNSTS